jgi:hypothetical protein
LTGNAGTSSSTNFLGTTDNVELILKANSVERMRFTTNTTGTVLVNTTTPQSTNDVFESYTTGVSQRAIAGYVTGANASAIYGSSQNQSFAGLFIQPSTSGAGVSNPVVRIQNALTATATSPMLRIDPLASGSRGIFVPSTSTVNTATVVDLQKYGPSGDGIALLLAQTTSPSLINPSGTGINITHQGLGIGQSIALTNTSSTANGLTIAHDGNGIVLNAQNTATTATATIAQFVQSSNQTNTTAAAVIGQSASTRGGVFYASRADNNTVALLGEFNSTSSFDAIGVKGVSTPASGKGYGVYGSGNLYGVYANGNLGSNGTKSFAIDHPMDPENKILKHYSMESPEVLNVYRGNIVLDANGEATVQLPDYFHSINKEFSYVLTPIGAQANLYVKTEVDQQGTFRIAGGVAGLKVSWYVYADRNDPYVKQYPESTEVVVQKQPYQVGKYLRPELYGQPEEKGIFYGGKPIPVAPLVRPEIQKFPADSLLLEQDKKMGLN